jgi:phospholipid/cholesterol/gamma-HCH transport system substrate-binding protein
MHRRRRTLTNAILAFVVLAVTVGTLVLVSTSRVDKKYATASFPRAVSLYEGSDVRVLGVAIGEVESVTPAGTSVKVKFWYDATYDVPADAQAIIIAPAIVGDRFVQLTPVYTEGDVLEDGAEIGLDRTAVPLELDEIYAGIDELTTALGPDGANSDGALSHLIDVTAENFAGQGAQFNDAITNFSRLAGTLEKNREDFFAGQEELGRFVAALAENDQTVRDFNRSFAAAAAVLRGERDDLSDALANLGEALEQVSSFVRENKDALSKNIKGLNQLSKILVKQRAALDETLTAAPAALSNLFHAYNNEAGTLNNRTSFGENFTELENDPGQFLCGFVYQADPTGTACELIRAALGGAARVAALNRQRGADEVIEVEHIDLTLGGIVEAN